MKKKTLSRPLSLLLGAGLFLLFALPFVLLREQIEQMAALGYAGLFIACALSNVSVLLPSSSTVFVLLAASALNPVLCVLIGGLGTAVGEQCSYLCGKAGSAGFEKKDDAELGRVHRFVRRHAFVAVFLFALAPLPVFDLAGVAAGADRMPWAKYALAAFLGKTLKFALSVWAFMVLIPMAAQMGGLSGSIYSSMLSLVAPQ
ncbi:MAG: VTT domain-containing protein [Clostridia bacterium]|nr:VTT domain-containing protein [Clostridia bacterium]